MQKINQKYINSVVKKALKEDLRPMGDVTTKLIKFSKKKIKAKIIAKQNGIIAGIEFCRKAFKLIGKESIFYRLCGDLALDIEHTKSSLDWAPKLSPIDGIRLCMPELTNKR